MRKAILLTLWLVLPLAVVGGLFWYVFASLGAGPRMQAEPVGAGAGDAGGANAIGLWREEKIGPEDAPVDPRNWAGGVEVRVPAAAVPWSGEVLVLLVDADPERAPRAWVPHLVDGSFVLRLTAEETRGVRAFFVAPSRAVRVTRSGGEVAADDESGRALRTLVPPPIDAGGVARSEPLVVRFDVDSVLLNGSP